MRAPELIPEYEQDPAETPSPSIASIDAIGPNLGHMLILLVISAALLVAGQAGVLLLAQHLQVYGHHTFHAYALMVSEDARWLVPSQAFGYLLVMAAIVPLFRAVWQRRFAAGLHWNLPRAKRNFGRLLLLGLGCGVGTVLLGSVLPMPKDPPIMADLLHSPLGAWLMLLFGITGAPLFEEMFFRGFLLPAFLNAFRWLSLKGDLAPETAKWVGIPFSVIFTSLPFALVHAPQVSHAWAPVVLIGLVSVVLCAVRLRLDSLACSTIVHSAYNFTLFAGILVQTGGFRHLDRLAN